MKKHFVCILMLLCAMLCGCGGRDDTSQSTLRIAAAFRSEELDALAAQFEALHGDCTVVVDYYPDNAYDRLCTEIMAGDGPDVLNLYGLSLPLDSPYLLPSGTGTTLFYTAPFLVMLLYAFSGGGGLAALGGNHAFTVGARNTAVYLFCGIGAALLLGMWVALALRPRSLSVKLALLAPLMLPSAAVAMLWRTLIPWESLWVLILLLVWKVTGVNAVLFTAAHNKIPGEVIESGQLDGAGGLRLFLRVKWPYLVSSVFFAALIDLLFAWRTFREVYLLTGDYPHDSLYLIQHYLMHMFRRLQYGRLATASIVVAVAVVVITGLMFLLTNAQGKDVEA